MDASSHNLLRDSRHWAIAVLAAFAGLGPAQQAGAADASALRASATSYADGLIVRLKQAPAHHEMAREPLRAALEARRWADVLERSALNTRSLPAAPRRLAVGRDQVLLKFERPLSAAELEARIAQLRLRPEVDWVAPNVREQRQQFLPAAPSDPLFAQQWWLQAVGGSDANAAAERRRGVPGFLNAWASGIAGAEGAAGAVVAVLDTGITAHPELQGRLLPGRDFVSDDLFSNDGQPGRDDDPSDPGDWVDAAGLSDPRLAHCSAARSSWHGTSIAGLLAASSDNDIGVAGALRRGWVLPVRVAGRCGATVADIIDGMRWAAGLEVDGRRNPYPARVISLSFGGTKPCGREYQDTIDELRAMGVLVVAAAGNSAGKVLRPASCSGVVGVVALNRDGFKTRYSSFGPELSASGIATVGGDDAGADGPGALLADGGLVTLGNAGATEPETAQYAAVQGTSFAAPLVAGTLALMLSVNPGLSADQLIDGLRRSARPHVASPLLAACSETNPGRCLCTPATCGAGILDVRQALGYAAAPDGYTPPVWPEVRLDYVELAQDIALGAANAPDASVAPAAGSGGDTGGGAVGGGWLVLLAAAVAALRATRPAPGRACGARDASALP